MARRNVISFLVKVDDDASHALQNVSKEVDGLSRSLKGLAGTVLSIATIAEIARMADTYRLLQNRLRLVTTSTEELRAVTDKLVEVSIRSRTSFRSTADLYARVARSSRDLGLSQQELLDFTETVSKSIRISGSTSQEAAAGVIQFGQALASSRLSGDELRSVLEQMPRLAQAIADGMGVGIGRLRELGEAGDLTAVKVLDALRKAAPEIAAEFDKLVPIVSEAFTNLETAIFQTVGVLDEMSGTSTFVSGIVLNLADDLIVLGSALTGTIEPGEKVSETTERLAIALLTAAAATNIFLSSLKSTSETIFGAAADVLSTFIAQLVVVSKGQFKLAAQIGNDYADQFGDGFIEGLEDQNDDMTMVVANLMEKIGQIFGTGRIKGPEVDLTSFEKAAALVTKQALAAGKSLSKMREKLVQQNKAMLLSAETGMDFARALQLVKIQALATTQGIQGTANQIISLMNALRVGQEAVAVNDFLDDLNTKLIRAGQTAKDAAISTALAKLFEIGDPSDSQISETIQLAEDLFNAPRIIAVGEAVDELAVRLSRMGMTARNAFISVELEKLADAGEPTAAQIASVEQMAGQLFDLEEQIGSTANFLESAAKQMGRNIQDALADFLFDPFEEGLKGMVLGFVNAIRRMLAELLAFKVLQSLVEGTSLAQFLPSRPKGRAAGGPVHAGMPVLVGERGPELFVPGGNGSIVNNSASKAAMGGGMQFTTYIDASGADPSLISRLPQFMEARDKRLMLKVKEFVETGSVVL